MPLEMSPSQPNRTEGKYANYSKISNACYCTGKVNFALKTRKTPQATKQEKIDNKGKVILD
jgi:hypothetical protein